MTMALLITFAFIYWHSLCHPGSLADTRIGLWCDDTMPHYNSHRSGYSPHPKFQTDTGWHTQSPIRELHILM